MLVHPKVTVQGLADQLEQIHAEYEGACMNCITTPEGDREPYPCATLREFRAWQIKFEQQAAVPVRLDIVNGFLVEDCGTCTCGGSPYGCMPGCGWEPVDKVSAVLQERFDAAKSVHERNEVLRAAWTSLSRASAPDDPDTLEAAATTYAGLQGAAIDRMREEGWLNAPRVQQITSEQITSEEITEADEPWLH